MLWGKEPYRYHVIGLHCGGRAIEIRTLTATGLVNCTSTCGVNKPLARRFHMGKGSDASVK